MNGTDLQTQLNFRRILFLSSEPVIVESQLSGRDITFSDAGALRDDVSTGEITPLSALAYFDRRLGRYPSTGVKCGDRLPIAVDTIADGHRAFVHDNDLKDHGCLPNGERSQGISHALVAERYSLFTRSSPQRTPERDDQRVKCVQ